jgi:hypothetical protein
LASLNLSPPVNSPIPTQLKIKSNLLRCQAFPDGMKLVTNTSLCKIAAWIGQISPRPQEITMSESNSSRIEKATRQHVGATLTSEQIHELVKLADPTSTKGAYPSDAAYKRDEAGKLIPRGKMAYGDGVLEYLGPNSFKVLPTEQIVRRPGSAKGQQHP